MLNLVLEFASIMGRSISLQALIVVLSISSISCIRYGDIKVNIISATSQFIESKLNEAMAASGNFLVQAIYNNNNETNDNPKQYIEQFLVISTILQPVYPQTNTNWTELIRMERLREIAENNMKRINESMSTVLFNMHFLSESNDASNQSKVAIVQNIHSSLEQIVNVFEHPQSIFRYHPLTAIPSLFALATLFPLYNRIEAIITPQLAVTSTLSCKFDNVLQEYGTLAEFYRSEKLRALFDITPDNEMIYLDRFKLLKEARYPEFPPTDEISYCSNINGSISQDASKHMLYFKDEFSSEPGFYGSVLCYSHLVHFYRSAVAGAFNAARSFLGGSCAPEKRSRLVETGNGWLHVVVLAARAKDNPNGKSCGPSSFIGEEFVAYFVFSHIKYFIMRIYFFVGKLTK